MFLRSGEFLHTTDCINAVHRKFGLIHGHLSEGQSKWHSECFVGNSHF